MANDVVPDGHGLPNTSWSEVDVAKDLDSPEGQVALEALLTRYRSALITHLRAKFRLSREDAEDTVQGFVEKKVLSRNFIARVERSRGRFRTFLLSSLDRFAISTIRHNQARKRTPGTDLLPLHEIQEEELPSVSHDPEPEFDLLWVDAVMAGALLNMRHTCLSKGQDTLWTVFNERLLLPLNGDYDRPSYDELVQRFGLNSPSDAFNLLSSGKRIFRRHVQMVVAEYTRNEGEVEEEIIQLRRLITKLRIVD
jgi:RNA polymerase sigma-70 factor (ECF subfamily)